MNEPEKPTIRGALTSAQRFAQGIARAFAAGKVPTSEQLKAISVEALSVEIACSDVLDPNFQERERLATSSTGEATPRPWRVLERRETDDPMDIEEPYMDADCYIAGPSRMKMPETADPLEAQAVMNPVPVAWMNLVVQDDGQAPEANAAMIVHRVNVHEPLLEALRNCEKELGPGPAGVAAREAIAQAEKEEPMD